MMVLSQAPGGALSARRCTHSSPLGFTHQKPPLFSNHDTNSKFLLKKRHFSLAVANPESGVDSTSTTKPPLANSNPNDIVFVAEDSVPLEGVIQFEKPTSSRLDKWGRVALLAGGDVLALLLFSAIGRYSHGFPVFDYETLRTADPFIAGWFLGAYFLGGYGEDGRGMNGFSNSVIAAAKSWAVGVPLGILIRAVTSGHIPPYTFILVTMGSTAVLLIGWRALSVRILPDSTSKKNDMYRQGSPFELFELLSSLIRRW
ncbi:hypothetical protein K2173_028466 [Erythroxylum novogranatense]|uniref:Transmembrane protein n=1 Tax=Erythroxylum novogranatense TaxID=1862640 RepID=A0AAV8U4Y8_9ROSI|nr:hypothetical protein K2173_028466 [Erythroxylum novogranatense]